MILLAYLIESFEILFFPVKQLDDPHPRYIFRYGRIDLRQRCPHISVYLSYPPPEKHCQHYDCRHDCKRDQCHGDVQAEHDHYHTCQYGDILQQRDQHIGIYFIQCFRIVCHTGDKPADGIPVKIGKRHLLHVGKKLLPDIEYNGLAGITQNIDLEQVEQETGNHQQQKIHSCSVQRRSIALFNIVVDGHADQVRSCQICRCRSK